MRLSSRKLPKRDGRPRLTASLLLPRQVVIQAHQEQLDEMAELGFKEETLMSQLAPANAFTIFDKIKGTKQTPAPKFCSLPPAGPPGPA